MLAIEHSDTAGLSARPLVEMKGIVKTFGGIHALNDVNLNIYPGEVHVIMGENGAGKSTLMKILSGIYQPSAGEIMVDGRSHNLITPKLAAQYGISIIYQELSVINISTRGPVESVKNGMAYITESRRQTGFMPNFSINPDCIHDFGRVCWSRRRSIHSSPGPRPVGCFSALLSRPV